MPRSASARAPRSYARSKSPEPERMLLRMSELFVGKTSLTRVRRNASGIGPAPSSSATPQDTSLRNCSSAARCLATRSGGTSSSSSRNSRKSPTEAWMPALREEHWPARSSSRRRMGSSGNFAARSLRRRSRGVWSTMTISSGGTVWLPKLGEQLLEVRIAVDGRNEDRDRAPRFLRRPRVPAAASRKFAGAGGGGELRHPTEACRDRVPGPSGPSGPCGDRPSGPSAARIDSRGIAARPRAERPGRSAAPWPLRRATRGGASVRPRARSGGRIRAPRR